jgi:hypothetical protein
MTLQIAQLRTFSDALLWAGASALGVVLCGVGLLHLLNRYGSSEP